MRSERPQLRRMALFDAVINNADRKGGHLLPVGGGSHIFGIDHGIAFHCEDKLRTLLWGWRGRKLSPTPNARCWRSCASTPISTSGCSSCSPAAR